MADKTPTQLDIVGGILSLLDRLGVKKAEPRIVNACIAAANSIIEELDRNRVDAVEGMGLDAWLASDDTGMSSEFMAKVLCGRPRNAEAAYPWDPDDFGRCYRFLLAVPEARANLHRMAKKGGVWAAYVQNWAEMERIYLEELSSGSAPKLYKLMQELRDSATAGRKS